MNDKPTLSEQKTQTAILCFILAAVCPYEPGRIVALIAGTLYALSGIYILMRNRE